MSDATKVSDTAPEAPTPLRTTSNGRIKASPLARRLARERGIDIASLTAPVPTGASSRRTSRARRRVRRRRPSRSERRNRVIPLTNIRKTIARRLTAAWQAPVFQLTVTADMTRANELVVARP